MEPLRIGILGAARIAELAIIEPAAATGHRIVAVAARDPQRASAFADKYGINRSHSSYQALVSEPEVEVVYNPLVNSAHAEWNTVALLAGKHVLSEKPFASNALGAAAIREVAAGSDRQIVEGFHYAHHPSVQLEFPSGLPGTVTVNMWTGIPARRRRRRGEHAAGRQCLSCSWFPAPRQPATPLRRARSR